MKRATDISQSWSNKVRFRGVCTSIRSVMTKLGMRNPTNVHWPFVVTTKVQYSPTKTELNSTKGNQGACTPVRILHSLDLHSNSNQVQAEYITCQANMQIHVYYHYWYVSWYLHTHLTKTNRSKTSHDCTTFLCVLHLRVQFELQLNFMNLNCV